MPVQLGFSSSTLPIRDSLRDGDQFVAVIVIRGDAYPRPSVMPNKTQPGPTTPFYKEKGKWSFYVFPRGLAEEAGDYRDEETARAASLEAYRVWQANGCRY